MSKSGYKQQIEQNRDGSLKVGGVSGVPNIAPELPDELHLGEPAAWFLGPRAENQDLLRQMIQHSLDSACEARRSYPNDRPDPEVITAAMKQSPIYQAAARDLLKAHAELVRFLADHATPYSSLRYQGHMLWDNTLPAVAAYFAAMLHNPNNVTIEASTSTTPLGILVGWDLCQMVGYRSDEAAGLEPWAHITADGTVANIEATWTTRECKYLAYSLRRLVESKAQINGRSLESARDMPLNLCDGSRAALMQASVWQLVNLTQDEALSLPARLAQYCGIKDAEGAWDEFAVWDALRPHTLNSLGWPILLAELSQKGLGAGPVMITPATQHYCWPKAAALCGLGHGAMLNVLVDELARMQVRGHLNQAGEICCLEEHLHRCLQNQIPVLLSVAVAGTTEEGAVDSIEEILALREEFRSRGLDFSLHVDAAWGGYFVTAIRENFELHGLEQAAQAERNPALPTPLKSAPLSMILAGPPWLTMWPGNTACCVNAIRLPLIPIKWAMCSTRPVRCSTKTDACAA
jgi:hypothetical protein